MFVFIINPTMDIFVMLNENSDSQGEQAVTDLFCRYSTLDIILNLGWWWLISSNTIRRLEIEINCVTLLC